MSLRDRKKKKKCPVVFKVCLKNKAHALNQIAVALKRGLSLTYYKCPFCRSLHLTRKGAPLI